MVGTARVGVGAGAVGGSAFLLLGALCGGDRSMRLAISRSSTVVVVRYREIERRFLDAAVRERWGEGIIFPVIDTMDIGHRGPPVGP